MSSRCQFSPPLTSALHLPLRRRFYLHPITSSSAVLRRHRRHLRRRLLKKYAPNSNSTFPEPYPLPTIFKLSDDTLHISLKPTLTSLQRLHDTANQCLDYGRDAWDDLRTAVVVDRTNGGFTISCRRSTVELAAALFLSSLVLAVSLRGLFRSRKTAGEALVYRRDRSLGGREVVVGKRETDWSSSTKSRRELTPLSADDVKDYETTRRRKLVDLDRRRRKKKAELPQWWPQVVNFGTDETVNKEEYQRLVNMLVKAIMDRKMAGEDISTDDVVQLRYICKTYGVRAIISTSNSRDSLYRVSINFVLDFCETYASISNMSTSLQINGEDVRDFIAGLADNIGLDSAHAARMVSAAVAARTRSKILQAWALEVQNKHSEALVELNKVCLIHRIFPPEENSPEMEMVARGLDKSLSADQREYMLNSFITLCGNDIDRSVVEALGLT